MTKMFRKFSFLFFILIGFIVRCYSQNSDYDNFKKKYEYYSNENKLDSALYFAKKMNVWALKNEGDSSLNYAISFGQIGDCMNDIDSVIILYLKTISILKTQNKTKYYEKYLNKLGLKYFQNNRLESADSCFNQYLDFVKDNKEYIKNVGKAYNNLGAINLKLENFNKAEKYFINSLEISIKNFGEYHKEVATVYNNLGNLYYHIGDLPKALKNLNLSINNLIQTNNIDSTSLAIRYSNIAIIYSKNGQFDLAELFSKKALDIRKKSFGEESIEYSRSLTSLGVLMKNIGDFRSAEQYILGALEIKRKISGNSTLDYAESLNSLGGLYNDLGNFYKARKCYEQSMEIRLNILGPEHSDYAESLNNLGLCYFQIQDFDSTEIFLFKALEVIKKSNAIKDQGNYAVYLNNVGVFYRNTKKYELSRRYLTQSLLLKQKQFGEFHFNNARNYFDIAFLDYLVGDYESSITNYERALKIYSENLGKNHPDYLDCLFNIALVYWKKEDYYQSETILKTVLETKIDELSDNFSWMSSNQKALYLKSSIYIFNFINSFASQSFEVEKKSSELSLRSNLITKSLLLETSRELNQIISISSDQLLKSQFNEKEQISRIVNKMRSERSVKKEIIERFNQQSDSLDKILVNKLGEYAASKRKFEITWKDVQANLTSADAAIEFARYYDFKDSTFKYMALVVRPEYEYPKLVKLGSEVNIKNASFQKEFSELYNYIWRGVDSLLLGVKTVYYSPVGELNNISFSALIGDIKTSNQIDTNQSNWSYLMDRYELHQLTTTRYLADETLKKNEPLPLSIKLIGGVNYTDLPLATDSVAINETTEDLALQISLQNEVIDSKSNRGGKISYLKGSEIEVKEIAKTLKNSGWATTISDGKNAGEYQFKEELKEKSPGIIHIATHGFAFPEKVTKEENGLQMKEPSNYKVSEDPMVRCGLMFSGANISWNGDSKKMIETTGDDGILTAAEVANLDLSNTKLVVLSACETGLGKIESSEGTFGLKRGFKLAGVDQIIVSLWKVPDNESMELMTLFYSELAKTNDIDLSFNKAQKEMRYRYPYEPEKWAGFVLVR